MKKILLSVLMLSATLFCSNVNAQLSQGGTPASFDKHFQPAQALVFENMPAVDVPALQAEDAINDQSKGPFRFGFNHLVNFNLNNSGTWTTLANGDRVWQLGVKSKGALTINLAFDDFYMPEGAKMFVYNADRTFMIGAFTSANNVDNKHFATDLVAGEAVVIEYDEPHAVLNQGRINLFRVTHGYRGVEDYAAKAFGDAGTCQVNINCPLGSTWQSEKHGVVCLVVGGSEFCSGSLVNDVPQDARPFVLTANHCSESNDWATWVFRFNWEGPACSNPGTSPSTAQSLSTSTLRARNGGSDFCLVEITGGLVGGTVPASYSPYFNGWSNINTPATSVIGIHHPSGDIKKISQSTNPVTSNPAFDAGNGPADCWQVGTWTTACTEPGSSGSPLFDQNHRIIGQLYGGPSACGVATSSDYDCYGKFATSWLGGGTSATQLKIWLDAGSTGATTTDGYDPNALPPAYAHDAGIQTINAPATGYSSCNTSITPQVVLKNYGSATLTSCDVNYQIDAATPLVYHWTGSLLTNQNTTITLTAMTGISAASHTFHAYTSNPDATTEDNPSNDGQTSTFTIITASPVVATPLVEGFESTFPSANWTIGNPDANVTWAKVTTAGGFTTSASSAMMDNYTSTTSLSGQSDFIYSPYVDLSSAGTPISLKFDVAYARYSATYSDSLKVKVTTDCGSTWTQVYSKGGTTLATSPDNASTLFVPTTAAQWRTETVSLNSYAGSSAVRIEFENKSGWGQTMYLDNINITSAATGINTIDLNSSFNVYPNPNDGQFNIALNLASAQNVTVKVMNVVGEVVVSKVISNVSTGIYNIDMSSEAKGMYFVEISTGTEKTIRKINVIK